MSVLGYTDLTYHVGHKIVCVNYADKNTAIECEDCNEVLFDFDVNDEPISQEVTD